MGCPPTLHTAYRIRRHHTIRPSDYQTCIYIPFVSFLLLASTRRKYSFYDGFASLLLLLYLATDAEQRQNDISGVACEICEDSHYKLHMHENKSSWSL